MTPPSTADFGFAQVPIAEKTALVKAVFTRAAPHYDFMNDVMSAGGIACGNALRHPCVKCVRA